MLCVPNVERMPALVIEQLIIPKNNSLEVLRHILYFAVSVLMIKMNLKKLKKMNIILKIKWQKFLLVRVKLKMMTKRSKIRRVKVTLEMMFKRVKESKTIRRIEKLKIVTISD